MAKEKKEKQLNLTFLSKDAMHCPVCDSKFFREDLISGGGRLVAGKLTDELRRLYEPTQKFGEVFPLIYSVVVCPSCLYASMQPDFAGLPSSSCENVVQELDKRMTAVKNLFPSVNFSKNRGLQEGAASYYLAMLCYEHFDKKHSPTIKQAICAIRAAWLFDELHKKLPTENYDYVRKIFYQKALFLYKLAINYEQTGKEQIASVKSLGPDVDKNFGFDGTLYLASLLEYKYGNISDPEKRKEKISSDKRSIARIFGLGRSSKNKPGPLLEVARELYEKINNELHEDD